MPHILPSLFNRRAELVAELATVDTLIMAESKNFGVEVGTPVQQAINSYGNMPATVTQQHNGNNSGAMRIPPGLTIKASVMYVMEHGPKEGMTVRDIRSILRSVNGPERALNIDQVMVGLMKAGKARSISTPGQRNRYALISQEEAQGQQITEE